MNQSVQRQFGVQGGVSGLVEYFDQLLAEQQQQQRLERGQTRRRDNRITTIISLTLAVIIPVAINIKKGKKEL